MGRAWAVAGMMGLVAPWAEAQTRPGSTKSIKLSSKPIDAVKNEVNISVRGDYG